MKLSDLEVIAKPFFIGENETKIIDLGGGFGTFIISLIRNDTIYNVVVRNITEFRFLNPVEYMDRGYTDCWMKSFDELDQAKAFAEVVYLNARSKLINRFSFILDQVLDFEIKIEEKIEYVREKFME